MPPRRPSRSQIRTREAALDDLLAALFSAEELRVHLAREREGSGLVQALPEGGVSPAFLCSSAVAVLDRRGLVDREFFDNLEAARSGRTAEIRRVRALWLHNPTLARGELWAEGRFELVCACGQGGFGQVWKAIDTCTGAYVALKILHDHHSVDRTVRQRFFRGAAVLAELSHPSIVRVRSGVEQEGLRLFYVMEFITGDGLDSLIGRRPRDELIGHLVQVGDALAHVHARGLLHRDVKPSNILVTGTGQAKLIDFDLVTGDGFATTGAHGFATPTFAPPEAAGPLKATPAYDVFSLARSFELVIRAASSTSERSAALDAALANGLRDDPDRRTRSVAQLCDAILAALDLQPCASPDSSSQGRAGCLEPPTAHASGWHRASRSSLAGSAPVLPTRSRTTSRLRAPLTSLGVGAVLAMAMPWTPPDVVMTQANETPPTTSKPEDGACTDEPSAPADATVIADPSTGQSTAAAEQQTLQTRTAIDEAAAANELQRTLSRAVRGINGFGTQRCAGLFSRDSYSLRLHIVSRDEKLRIRVYREPSRRQPSISEAAETCIETHARAAIPRLSAVHREYIAASSSGRIVQVHVPAKVRE